jgi:long-chain acyl-CoA synthetase
MQVKQLLLNRAKQFHDKPALIFKDNVLSFNDLKDKVFPLAEGLHAIGVRKSLKVAIYLPNYPEYIYSYLALFSLGAVVVPLDFMLTDNEVVNFLNHSDACFLIVREKKGMDLLAIKARCPQLKKIILLSEDPSLIPKDQSFLSWEDVLKHKGSMPSEKINESDHAAIFYTSGSTGHPKGVLLNYGHLDNPVRSISHFLHPTDKDSYLCAGVPFSHVGGLDYMLFMLYFGSTLILMDRFHPLEALKNLEKYKATVFCIVPSMFVAILSMKECEKFDISSLRYPVVFGAPSSPELLGRFHQLCPNASLRNGWGMTETAAPNSYSPADISKLSSIGPFGVGMEAKIVDDEGDEVPLGQKGELWVKGDGVMVGYYKEEGLTNEVLTPDGWLKTGDIARKDEEGLFYLVGRKKDMIKVAGEIVFSPEVEEVIHRHPKVEEVAVIGVPDELRGEVPKAFIVAKKDQTITPEEIRSFCREYLAHFKLPHTIEIRETLPKNRVGKIDKELLKKQ